MSVTLSYGYVVPQNPDTGATFWGDLEFDITRLNAHSHNAVDSAPIVKTQSISSAAWGSDLGGGMYEQLVTLPGSLTFDTVAIEIRTPAGEVSYPEIIKNDATSYYVRTNDNTQSLVALYT
jgi:hypothetical protein